MTSPRSLSRAWLSLPHAVARGPWSHLQLCPGCHHPSPASLIFSEFQGSWDFLYFKTLQS